MAIRLYMEIILFFKVYHPSNGSSFTLVSTYFQNNSLGCQWSNPRGVIVTFYHMGPITPLSSHREPIVSQGFMGIIPFPGQPICLDLSEGRQPHILGPPDLFKMMDFSLNIYDTSGSMRFFKHFITGIPSIKSLLEWKYATEKDPIPEDPGKWKWGNMRKITTHEKTFTWEGAFPLRENIYCPLTWSPHHAIWEEKAAKQGFSPLSSSGDPWF